MTSESSGFFGADSANVDSEEHLNSCNTQVKEKQQLSFDNELIEMLNVALAKAYSTHPLKEPGIWSLALADIQTINSMINIRRMNKSMESLK